MRDRLAALFIDMNRLDDADEMNDLALGVRDSTQNACMRQARRIVLHADRYRGMGIGKQPRLFQGACTSIEAEVACWLDTARCAPYFRANNHVPLARYIETYAAILKEGPDSYEPLVMAIEKLPPADLDVAVDIVVTAARDLPCPAKARFRIRAVVSALLQKLPEESQETLRDVQRDLRESCAR